MTSAALNGGFRAFNQANGLNWQAVLLETPSRAVQEAVQSRALPPFQAPFSMPPAKALSPSSPMTSADIRGMTAQGRQHTQSSLQKNIPPPKNHRRGHRALCDRRGGLLYVILRVLDQTMP